MPTERGLAESTSDVDDILTEINGLGKAAERDLHSLGIRRFDALIKYTPEELAKRLYEHTKNSRYSVTFIENNNWIGQAERKLAERKKSEILLAHAAAAATPTAQATGNQVEDWKLQAEFTLYFENKASEQGEEAWQTRVWQTRIRDKDCDEEKTFDGIEPHPWVNWILEQAGLPVAARSLPSVDDAPFDIVAEAKVAIEAQARAVSPPEETQIKITEVQLSEIGPSIGVREKQIQTQVRFKISGPEVEKLVADNIPCRLEVHTVDTESGMSAMVTSGRVELKAQVFEYTSRQQFPMPEVGRYRLYCLALLLPPGNLVAYHEGPIITVVP